jgi:DNA-binding transcriptional LysR family regulator
VVGEFKDYRLSGEYFQVRSFCPRCGTTLYWESVAYPDYVGVAGGCFTDSPLPEPTLFHRTTRSLSLTEEGRGYHAQVARILNEIEEANLSVSKSQAAPRGRLRVSAPMSFGILHIGPAIKDFLVRYPEVELDLALNDRYVDVVDEGFDLAIRVGRLSDSSLIVRKLAQYRMMLCASSDYLRQHDAPRDPDDLKKHLCLCYSTNSLVPEWQFVTKDGKPWLVQINGPLHASNGDILRTAALQGLGIVYLPSFIVGPDVQVASLASLLPEFVPTDTAIHAVYPHTRHLSPKVRAFIDFLAQRYGPRPHWDLVE